MDALELVRSRNRANIELPSGLGATIGLVRISDCISTLGIPLPVMRELQDQANAEEPKDLSPEAIAGGIEFRHEMVRRTLKQLAPSLAELNGSEQDITSEVVDELTQEDFDLLAEYALRDKPFPTTAGA